MFLHLFDKTVNNEIVKYHYNTIEKNVFILIYFKMLFQQS